MLGLMRRHSRSIFVKFIFVGIILSFVIWGWGASQSRKSSVAVSVNGADISLKEYDRSFQNLYSYYREQFKERFTDELIESMNIQKMALDSLIDKVLLLQEAKKLGLSVDKIEVRSRIQTFPAFQNKGIFDNGAYLQVLSYNKVKPRDFETEQESLILMEKASEAIKKPSLVSEGELLEAYKKDKVTINLEFVKFSPANFEKGIKPGTKEMKGYFASNVGDFTIPEKISLAYARFEPGAFLKEIKLSGEDYEDYYKSYIDDFSIPAKTRASHILIKFGDDKEKAKVDATAILERVEKGEDFASLAKEYSGDGGSASKGGDLGFFSRGMMVKPFEDAALSMGKGEVSELVETLYGFHIIKVTDFAEEKSKPLAEVKAEIRKVLESEISKELAQGRADDIYYEAIKGESLDNLLKEEKVGYRKTDMFSLDDIPVALKGLAESVKESSKMDTGWISRPIEVDNTFFILALLKKEAPREPLFDEVADAVKKALIKEKASKAAAKKAEALLAKAKGGKILKSLATSSGLKLEETGAFSRSRNFVPKIGISEEIVAGAFLLTAGAPLADKVYSVGGDAFIFRLKERKEIDAVAFEKEKELLRAKLLEKRREEVFKKWLEDAKNKASLEYHEDLLNLRG